ncbi:hypothetical protein ABEB36_002453 [Hypothenemus hampei]|uniref:Uncharacterized protein n=1 Tax=Hypothenemus hampei TaxID=57062 RepID=A0ABD1F5T4_HYPHA
MNLFCLILESLSTSLTKLQQTEAAIDNPRLLQWFKNCQLESGASNEDYETVKLRKVPTTPEGICMVQCLFTKLHIIDNGRFNERGFVITFSPVARGDLRKLGILKEIASECQKEIVDVDVDTCNITEKVLHCFARNKNKLDLSRRN